MLLDFTTTVVGKINETEVAANKNNFEHGGLLMKISPIL